MPPDEPCRKYSLYTPTHGRKRPGHQRTHYLTYIQNLMGDSNNDLTLNIIAEHAMDRGAGETLWSPAVQPNDDDDDETLYLA